MSHTVADAATEKTGGGKVAVDVRMCKDCQRTIFSKADFARELHATPPEQRAYQNLMQFEHGIRLLLPKFHRLLAPLQDPTRPPTPAQLAAASQVRRRLTDAFTRYDVAARRIRDLPVASPTQDRLRKAVYAHATSFLHVHMLPLKSLPKIMKHAAGLSASASATPPPSNSNPSPHASLAPIHSDSSLAGRPPGITTTSSSSSSIHSGMAPTALEAAEKELRERLMVLEEQRFFVGEMVAEAQRRRRFDEVAALVRNVEEISREIDALQTQVDGMDGFMMGVDDRDG
jgi:hypothetical protein